MRNRDGAIKYHCHLCGKVTAKIRDASIAKGTVFVCPLCVDEHLTRRGDATDSMPPFMSEFFRGLRR